MQHSNVEGFIYKKGELHAGDVPVSALAAELGTPTYVYSAPAIRAAYQRIRRAFGAMDAHLHYAVKACANLHVCRLLREEGAGMDVVSGGEMERAWLAGTPMSDIVFAGVAKTEAEIRAALDGRYSQLTEDEAQRFGRSKVAERGPVGLFNVESESELRRIAKIAGELGVRARASIRVNPDVDARTHEYTTTGKVENKFGIDADRVPGVFARCPSEVDLVGLHVHIGSPVHEVEPFEDAVRVLLTLIDDLAAAGHQVESLDLGGGWPSHYKPGDAPAIEEYGARLAVLLKDRVANGLRVLMEPGRSILGNSGVLITRVQHVKHGRTKTFVICDAGMHTLIRPALYKAYHAVWPTRWDGEVSLPGLPSAEGLKLCDVVGPICETGDFIARDRPFPEVEQDDLLAVFSAGAYGMSMTSNYNDHGRPAEVLVDGDQAIVINERQRLAGILATEATTRELEVEKWHEPSLV